MFCLSGPPPLFCQVQDPIKTGQEIVYVPEVIFCTIASVEHPVVVKVVLNIGGIFSNIKRVGKFALSNVQFAWHLSVDN